ncbi:MAG: CBS domain-containing protein [Bacteroidota bacterium]
MIVRELISDSLPPVKSSDTAAMALAWMNEFKISQLPIIDQGGFVGIVTENDILDAVNPEAQVAEIKYTGLDGAYIYQGQHIYDAIDIMSNLELELLPVLDEEKGFLGVITLRDLIQFLDQLFAIREPGSILVLEIPERGYMLSEIARIVENNDAKVLSLYLTPDPGKRGFLLTLKLNVEDLSRVIATFERFQYQVAHTYNRLSNNEDLRSNLDALMRYLDI